MFIPVLLMGGIVGRVFREFAVTIAVAIVVSGFVSLTLTPMLCARVLKAHDETRKPNIVLRVFERMFDSWLRAYEWALDWVLARKAMMLVVTLATLAGTIALYIVVPKGFFPQEDTGFLFGITEAATDTSFEAMTVRQKELADILSRDPAVEYINSTVGAGGPNPTANNGRLFIALKPRKERDSATVVMARLRQKATQVPGMQAFFQSIQNLNIGGRPSKSQYQYTLQSGDTESLYRLAPEMRDKIAQGPGIARRHHRSLHQESADDGRHRPRESRGLRHHRRSGAQPALQRLWRAPGRHHLHAVQRLPDHSGSAAAVSGRSVRPLQALREDRQQPDHSARTRWPNWCRRWGRCRSIIRASSRR